MAYSLATSQVSVWVSRCLVSGVWYFRRKRYEFGDLSVQFGQSLLCRWAVGSDFLGGVIQVRQIDVEKMRLGLLRGDDCRVDDPGCALILARGPQKFFSGKSLKASRSWPYISVGRV